MNLFRKETIIYSKKTPSEITTILKSVTGSFFPSNIEFLGIISDTGFDIEPVRIFKNSLNPQIKGHLLVTPEGTEIHIKAEPHNRGLSIVLLFTLLVLCIYYFLNGLISMINDGYSEHLMLQILITFPFFLIILILLYNAFTIPAQNAINRLKALLS